MAIQIGTRIGSHEITALLGKGGMGEVYRARDTRLKREVAIKILPDEFSRDQDRVGRFQREAEVLASLNHPNIAAIHSLEEAGGSRYLVLELVEGETLEERLRRGPLPVEEALNISKNICEALEAAHEKGVVHRDLKPANVKITPDGKVKVLDFGLAKAMEGSQANAGLSNSPTLVNSFAATNAGVIIGTAAYMSPEQARGYAADQRSDIFSFGCVLYEMLTAQRAFDGETVTDILASVLAREPAFTLLPKDLNPRLSDFLRRCLEKNRKRRWHCVADLRAELESIATAPKAAPASEQRAAKPRPLWRRAIPLTATAILFSAIAGIAVWTLKPSAPLTVTRFPIAIPSGQLLFTAFSSMGVSPDGTRIVYVADRRLYLRSVSDSEIRPIPGSEGPSSVYSIYSPVFSPDGLSIAFGDLASPNGAAATIRKIAVTGGAAVTIYSGTTPVGIDWDSHGIVFVQNSVAGAPVRILLLSPNGGTPQVLTTLKQGEVGLNAQLLPGGRAVLFTMSNNLNDWQNAQVIAQDLKSGERKIVVQGGNAARYVPTGHIVYVLGGVLFAVPFDVRHLEVLGGATPIVEGVQRGNFGSANFAVSNSGSLAYIPGPASTAAGAGAQNIGLIERTGEVKPLVLVPGSYVYPRISPDGKRVAFGTDDGKESIIWVYDVAGGSSMRRLTFNGRNRYPIWTADSQRVAFQSDRDGDRAIFWQRTDGTGTAERLTKPEKDIEHIPDSSSPDGKEFSFTAIAKGSGAVWIFSLQERKATVFAEAQASFIGRSAFSPDGKWLAYQSSETGSERIFVQPFPATGTKYQISKDSGHHPLWSPDGKELFYIPGPGQFLKMSITTRPEFTFGNPIPAPNGSFIEGGPAVPRSYDITPDGKRFLGVVPIAAEQNGSPIQRQIQVVLHWFEELKQRVPVR
jgi:serine/threonine-protein kinase